jgi:hypothetical protein
MTPEHQRVTIGDFECLPTRTTSTPRRRVFNPPSIAMINAPYSSDPIACVLTHNQRQSLQIISQARDSFNQIGNDLSQDSTDNLQIICLPLGKFRPFNIDIGGEGSSGSENRAGDSGVSGWDGARDGLKGGLSVGGRNVGVLQDQYGVGLFVRGW